MIAGIDIEAWLAERSLAVERSEREVVFEHSASNKSLLCCQTGYQPVADCPALAGFYEKFSGGFIGNGFLLIGAPEAVESTSAGITVPTIEEIRAVSIEQGIVFDEDEIPFMTTGYMFVYAFSHDGRLRCHDRDFGVVTEDRTFVQVLNDWWTINEAEERHDGASS